MITVITPHGTIEIPRDVVAEGEEACGAYAAAELAKLEAAAALAAGDLDDEQLNDE